MTAEAWPYWPTLVRLALALGIGLFIINRGSALNPGSLHSLALRRSLRSARGRAGRAVVG
jgi:hypothetical protein